MHKINQITWIIINALLAGIIGVILFSGKIYLFLAPRIIPIVYMGFIVLCVLLIYNILRIKSAKQDAHSVSFELKYLLFAVPILLYIFTTPESSTVNSLENQNVNLAYAAQSVDAKDNTAQKEATPTPALTVTIIEYTPTPDPDAEPSPVPETSLDEDEDGGKANGAVKDAQLQDVADMQPCVLLSEQGRGPQEDEFEVYVGQKLEDILGEDVNLYGFVYKDETFPEDTILVSRLYISCCVADASVIGFHVKVEDAGEFEENEWIQVKGTVEKFVYNMYGTDYEFPVVTGGTVKKCEQASSEKWYVYP